MNRKNLFGWSFISLFLIFFLYDIFLFIYNLNRELSMIIISYSLIPALIGLKLVLHKKLEEDNDIDLKLVLSTTILASIIFIISFRLSIFSVSGAGLAAGTFFLILINLSLLILILIGSFYINIKQSTPRAGNISIYIAIMFLLISAMFIILTFKDTIDAYNRASKNTDADKLYKTALSKVDPIYCYEIKKLKLPYESDRCFHDLAKITKNASLCKEVILTPDLCYFNTAHTLNDKNLCLIIKSDNMKYDCLFWFVSNFKSVNECDQILDRISFCKAIVTQDPIYCKEITILKDSCYKYFAIIKNSSEYCDYIDGDFIKSNCINSINSFRIIDCEKKIDPRMRYDCYTDYAILKNDQKLCNGIEYTWYPYNTEYTFLGLQPTEYYKNKCISTVSENIKTY